MNEELKKLNEKLGEAEKSKDVQFFEEYLSEDLLFRRASGKVHTKRQFLEGLENPKLVYHDLQTEIVRIVLSDDNLKALAQVIVHAKITNDGNDGQGHYMNLRFFQRQHSTWQLVNWYNYEL